MRLLNRYRIFHQGRWPVGAEPDSFQYVNFAVRNEQFRLVGLNELYDVQADPGETLNVIDQYPEIKAELMEAYEKWWMEARPLMVNEFVPMSKVKPFHELYNQQMKNEGMIPWNKPEFK